MSEEVDDVKRDAKTFFCAVRPSSRIVDNYSFNGDLETIFNMTKETETTWLFRRRFDVAAKRIVCRSEKSAVCEFLEFVLNLKKPVVFISVDEETLSVVLSKCKQISREKFEELWFRIRGFTYWSRTVKQVFTYSVDLEDYNRSSNGFCSAFEVAKILMFAFLKLDGSKQSYISIGKLKRPHRHTVKKYGKITIEISSTFRNAPSCLITGEKKEEVVIEDSSDESDVEILPDETNQMDFKSELQYSSQLKEFHEKYFEGEEDMKNFQYQCGQRPKLEAEDRDEELNDEYFEQEEKKKNFQCEQLLKNNIVTNLVSEDKGQEVEIVRLQKREALSNLPFPGSKTYKYMEKKGKFKCHFCDAHYSSSSKHYTRVHKAEAWSILPFPDHKAYKYIEEKGKFECQICCHEFNRSHLLLFPEIDIHLKIFHKIPSHKLPLFHMPKKVKDSQKRKETGSNESSKRKRIEIKQHPHFSWPMPMPPPHNSSDRDFLPQYGTLHLPSPPPPVYLHPAWSQWNATVPFGAPGNPPQLHPLDPNHYLPFDFYA